MEEEHPVAVVGEHGGRRGGPAALLVGLRVAEFGRRAADGVERFGAVDDAGFELRHADGPGVRARR